MSLVVKLKNLFIKQFEWFVLIFFTIYYGFYTYVTMANVVFLGWFFQIPIFEKYFNNDLHFWDLFTRFGEHGMFGYNVISLINLKFFSWNTLFDAYLNVFIVLFTGIFFYIGYKRSFGKNYNILNKILVIVPIIVLFSIVQQSSASMETQIRLGLLFFFFTSYVLDKYIIYGFTSVWNLIYIIFLFFLSINIFGTFYSFAWVPSILMCFIIKFFKNKKLSNFEFILIITIIFFCISYFFEYWNINSYKTNPIQESTDMRGSIIALVTHPLFSIKWMLAYLGSGTFGRTLFEDKIIRNDTVFILNGLFVFLVSLYSIIRFFISKMYEKTILPLFMIGYTFFIGLMVMLGRVGVMVMLGDFSQWFWGTNYWYAVHTKIGISACMWILIYDLLMNINSVKKIIKVFFPVFIIIFILGSQLLSTLVDWRRAPWVKKWYEEKILYILNPEKTNIDAFGYTPLVVNYEQSINVISFLKKYNLNVFSNLDSKNIIKLAGWNSDNWISKNAKTMIVDSKKGVLVINLYIPVDVFTNVYKNSIMLQVMNGKNVLGQQEFLEGSFDNGSIEVNFDIPKETELSLDLKLDKSFIPKEYNLGEDSRNLGIIVNNIKVK